MLGYILRASIGSKARVRARTDSTPESHYRARDFSSGSDFIPVERASAFDGRVSIVRGPVVSAAYNGKMKMKVSGYTSRSALARPTDVCARKRVCTWHRPSMSYPLTGTYLIAVRDVNAPYNLEADNLTTYTASRRRRRLWRLNDLHSIHATYSTRTISSEPSIMFL